MTWLLRLLTELVSVPGSASITRPAGELGTMKYAEKEEDEKETDGVMRSSRHSSCGRSGQAGILIFLMVKSPSNQQEPGPPERRAPPKGPPRQASLLTREWFAGTSPMNS